MGFEDALSPLSINRGSHSTFETMLQFLSIFSFGRCYRVDSIVQPGSVKTEKVTMTKTAPPSIFKLPMDVFHLIKEFLTFQEYKQFVISAAHPLFQAMRNFYYKFYLPVQASWRYYSNENGFRDRMLTSLASTSRQLSLQFDGSSNMSSRLLTDVSVFCHLRHLTLQKVKIDESLFQRIEHVQKLHLEGYEEMKALPKFQNIGEIIIKDFAQLIDVRNIKDIKKITLIYCPRLEDISSLEGSEDVTIKSCLSLKEVSKLNNVNKVHLDDCSSIVDIDCLNTVPSLKISNCLNVRNISNLSRVNALSMDLEHVETLPLCPAKKVTLNCTGIKLKNNLHSTSCFNSVEELIIENHPYSEDLTCLPTFNEANLRKLTFHKCSFPAFFPMKFENVHELELYYCFQLRNLHCVGHIPVLRLTYCGDVMSLDGLGQPTQQHVVLKQMFQVTDFTPVQHVKKVEIATCWRFRKITDLQYCEEIIIEDCFSAKNLLEPFSGNCKKIKIIGCGGINSLEGFETIPNVEIIDCGIKYYKKRKYP